MIRVHRPELEHNPGRAWRIAAETAMSMLIEAYRRDRSTSIELDESQYQAAKPFLMEFTHNKCAYCESLIANTHPGDVEHYRPKGRVRDEAGRIVKIYAEQEQKDHPGYWWLAYSWDNLLPSCIDCNRRREHCEAGLAAGKADHFAVRGKRAEAPGEDLSNEDALLLDPSAAAFDPNHHFDFLEDGKLKPKTPQAVYTCQLLGLNAPREMLVGERSRAYYEAKEKFTTLVGKGAELSDTDLVRMTRQINAMWAGETPHSAFARVAIESVRSIYQRRFNWRLDLPLPLPADATT